MIKLLLNYGAYIHVNKQYIVTIKLNENGNGSIVTLTNNYVLAVRDMPEHILEQL